MLEQLKASAGSGKTHALTGRFLELLCLLKTEYALDESSGGARKGWLRQEGVFADILAVTFTNKAASEMKARVIRALKKIALGDFESAPAPLRGEKGRQLASFWLMSVLRRYDSLNIRTIDSLLNLLVRFSSVGLGIPPHFELVFDEPGFLAPLYDELLDLADQGRAEALGILEDCADHILKHTTFKGFTPGMHIQRRLLHILSLLQKSSRQPCLDEKILRAGLQRGHKEMLEAHDLFAAELKKRGIAGNAHFRAFMERLADRSPEDAPPKDAVLNKEEFVLCCLKKELPLVDAGLERAYGDFRRKIMKNGRCLNAYLSAVELLPYARAAAWLLPEVIKLQKKSSCISGGMLPFLAARALNGEHGVSEACCRLGSRLTHLLIDEFQDTSREQWSALEPLAAEALSRGGSLCYAGDVKQAIYSWRGGDSSLFDAVAASPSLTDIERDIRLNRLESNWRSLPEIVRHNNECFGRLADHGLSMSMAAALLPAEHPHEWLEQAASDLRATFAFSEQKVARQGPATEQTRGMVRIYKFKAEDQADLFTQTRLKLKELFRREILPRRRAGDVAVLVRTAEEADFAAQCLLEQGISVITEHSFRLDGHPLVRRLVALLRFLDYPPDDLSFMSFITGPELFETVSGLTGEELFAWEATIRLEQNRRKETAFQPLYRFFIRDFPEIWELWLEPFHKQAGLMGVYDLTAEIFQRYSLPERTLEHGVYLRRFLELVFKAEKDGLSSLAAFLDYWDEHGGEEKIPSPENPDSVRIMTIHKAKGLEFKVVVMPFHRFSGGRDTRYALLESEGHTLLVHQKPHIDEKFHQERNTAALEKIHLLYVGWTRAAEELYAFVGGTRWDMRLPGIPRAMDLLLDHLPFSEDGLYSAGKPSEGVDVPIPPPATATTPTTAPLSGADADWQPMRWLPSLKIFRNPVPEMEYNQRVRGIIFHNCLESLHLPEKDRITAAFLPNLIAQSVSHSLHGFHLPVIHLEQVKHEITDALLWFCSLPETPRWLRNGRREQTIMDKQGNNWRLDLLVEENPASFLILEYKSGSPQPEHREQLLRYLSLLAESRQAIVRGLLVYLDERRLQEVLL
ncbi:MAG: UvrD-helicase domain-containing protein [Deltaproteobacteria bacterium]|jgi:ATP-dependent exoDNAse (exonuclease V) beta subunit|nr:UvrD-helicase domain-containing protein [Deltaproteobacteria bacterium]